MIKNNIYIYIFFLFFLSAESYIEIDLGHQIPQGSFDKYNDPGFSLRGSYSWSNSRNPHIKYDFSLQYLQFKKDTWVDFDLTYPVTTSNSEQSFGLLFGPRLMSPTQRGAIRPYIGFKGGFFIFTETMNWEWEEEINWGCVGFNVGMEIIDSDIQLDCDNNNQVSETLDSDFKFGALFEIGANMKIDDFWGLDFGLQYNIIPSLESYQSELGETENTQDSEINDLHISQISKTINADYITFYFGCYFKIW